MPDTNIYWDANPFLSYVNEYPERMPTLDALLDNAASGGIKIYTSAISLVEVAFAASEQKRRRLDQDEERKIDALWSDPDVIGVVEYHESIGRQARNLIREGITRGWNLKPMDAVHLATAQWLVSAGFELDEFHSYDRGLDKYGTSVRFVICEPYTAEPKML